ncbi:MAG: hypothetical protein IJD95_02435 [Clostridia bacterium]|nr:hypothetical protein [Clostridia bacterium]
MKKIIATVLALVLCLGLLSACTGGGSQRIPYDYGDGFKPYSPEITISVANPMADDLVAYLTEKGDNQENNAWNRLYREKLGIKIRYDYAFGMLGGYTEKLSAASMADNLPDFAYLGSGEFAYTLIKNMYERDQLADLTDAIEKLASDDLKNAFEVAGDEIFYPATFNGKKFAIPQIIGSENEAYTYYFLRKDWLDNLNLAIPSTFEELLSVCEAFANQDPDGNGEDDTYGLSFGGDFRETGSLFFAAYGAYPGQWIKSEDGSKLVYGSYTENTKRAIAQLHEMYKSGALNPAFNETGFDGLYTEFNTGKAGVFMGKVYYPFLLENLIQRNPDAEIVAVKAMAADGGEVKIMTPTNAAAYFVMNAKCNYPEAMVKMFNLYLETSLNPESEEQYYELIADKDTGKNIWTMSPVKTDIPGANARKANIVVEALQNGTRDELLPHQVVLYDQVKSFEENPVWSLYGDNMLWCEGGTESTIQEYFDNEWFMPINFNGAKTESMELYGDDLYSGEVGGFILMIMGENPIDSFDTMYDAWKDIGGADVEREINEWYSTVRAQN